MTNTPQTTALLCALLLPLLSSAADCSKANPELFVNFLPEFSESKDFAVQRTELPLPLLLWNEASTDGAPHKTLLSAAEYRRWPSLSRYMQDNDLQPSVKRQTKTDAVVDIQKEGRPGIVSFHFRIEAGCWRLWQYEVRER